MKTEDISAEVNTCVYAFGTVNTVMVYEVICHRQTSQCQGSLSLLHIITDVHNLI